MDNFNPSDKSKGVGDTIAKVTHFFGLDKVADAVAKMAGAEGCGCDERRQLLNDLFPYDGKIRYFEVKQSFNFANVDYFKGQRVEVNKNHSLYGGVISLVRDGMIEEIIKQ
jgi:hypothetical protein